MKQIIVLFIILIFKLSSAQVFGFFNVQKVGEGFFVGTEIVDKKTNIVLNPKEFSFEWDFPLLARKVTKNFINTIYLTSNKSSFENISVINLKAKKIQTQKSYQLTGISEIFLPSVKIVRKKNGLILPLSGPLDNNEILTVIFKNFPSSNFTYLWKFNGTVISNRKEISVYSLKEKSGVIEVKITNPSGELIIDSAYVTIKQ